MEMPHLHLFMMARRPHKEAFRDLPEGFHMRFCRRDELDAWKLLSIKDPQYFDYMTEYFNEVYRSREDEFFGQCLFACDESDRPVGTLFLWRAYDSRINTLHWFHVLPEYEGRGIGRALLTEALRPLAADDYPVFIHTHPTGNRAIKLYSDFGFHLISAPDRIGYRPNDYEEALPYLKAFMSDEGFSHLRAPLEAPACLLDAAASTEYEQFQAASTPAKMQFAAT